MVARQYAVWGVLLLTLAACYWVSLQDAETAEVVTVKDSVQLQKKPIDMLVSSHMDEKQVIFRSADTAPPVDLFAPLVPSVGSAEDIQSNQAPVAPTNPYSYAGRIFDDGEWTVFLTDGNNNFSVKVGEKLDSGWQLKRVDTHVLTLFYAPMKYEVKLDIGVAL